MTASAVPVTVAGAASSYRVEIAATAGAKGKRQTTHLRFCYIGPTAPTRPNPPLWTRDTRIVRFALIDLLALTLLVSLIAAIFAKREAMSATAVTLATLQTAIDQDADRCRRKEREIALLTRTIERRATDFGLLSVAVDRIAESLNEAALSMAGSAPSEGTVSRQNIPTFARQRELRERTRVYVPANLVCEALVEFMDKDGHPGFYEDFEEPRQHAIPLATGENLIEVHFDWNRAPNTFTATNHTNAVSIRSRAKDARGDGQSSAGGQAFYRHSRFVPPYGMTVFDRGVGFRKGTRIVVRVVESKQQ